MPLPLRGIERFTCGCLHLDDTLRVVRLGDALVRPRVGGELGPDGKLQTRRDLREVGKRRRRRRRLLSGGVLAHRGDDLARRVHLLGTNAQLGRRLPPSRTRLNAAVRRLGRTAVSRTMRRLARRPARRRLFVPTGTGPAFAMKGV